MTNTFDKAEARASQIADVHFGERVRIVAFTKAVNLAGRPDTTRTPLECTGIYSGKAVENDKLSKVVDVVSKDSEISFDLRNLLWQVKQGDQVTRHKTGVTYRVNSLRPDGEGRVVAKLTAMRSDA